MKLTYVDVLQRLDQENSLVDDITNLYDRQEEEEEDYSLDIMDRICEYFYGIYGEYLHEEVTDRLSSDMLIGYDPTRGPKVISTISY